MESYSDALQFLYGLQHRGIKFGLHNISTLLSHVGNPEHSFPAIHIAGTNGKGSTACFIASILTEDGKKTGLYTSPHLVRFNERIRVGRKEITDDEIVSYVSLIRDVVEKINATFFEASTCISFMHFAKNKVDFAVIETGLGGRLDATNVLTPLVSVITNIGTEHTDYLGSSLEKIAAEKAGIIKPGVPVVTSEQEERILDVFAATANHLGSKLTKARELASFELEGIDISHQIARCNIPGIDLKNARLGLSGVHQLRNAELAVAAIRVLQNYNHAIAPSAIERGLANVRTNSRIEGRLQQVDNFILDVAHNPPGLRALVTELKMRGIVDLTVIFGVMKDKDYRQMITILAEISHRFICVQPSVERALEVGELTKVARNLGFLAVSGGSVENGLRLAREEEAGKKCLVTGSFYVVGEARAFLEKKSDLGGF